MGAEAPRRPAKLRRRKANGSGDAEKGMFKSLKEKVDTCSNATESTRRKRGQVVIYDRPELCLMGWTAWPAVAGST